ncbi:hypothetical protein [Arthrobacter nitrophenolicus]|uniref:ABC-type transport system substrate-binding protein n=2 Tax=Arthrobacter nitrophenolicus TaxID=683150 RepID=A0ACC6TDD5_9MICC|nr:hypothetical protein [Arthrobacter nitrophenolicus]ELT45959.1 hypothetical protein G205_01893 [Arthrobacter nitrophenolicus]
MSSPKLSRRALITIAFIGALVVQAGVSFASEDEPYPGIRMPSFGSAPNQAGLFPTVAVSATITYADGTTLEPHVTELMNDFRFSSARYSFDYMFKPGSTVTPDSEVLAWLSNEARELGGGKKPERIDLCWRKTDLDIRTATYSNAAACESRVIDL